MNSVKLIGRLAQNPETIFTKTGKALTNFSVATSRIIPGQEGKEVTDFTAIVTWGNLAEKCGNGLAKGDKVFVAGRLSNRTYDANDGTKRRISEVVAEFVAKELWVDDSNAGGGTSNESPFDKMGHEVPGGY